MAAGTTLSGIFDEAPRAPARRGALGEVLALAAPFVLSSGVGAIKLFSDRMMLAWHSDLALTAALSAGLLAYFIASPFMGMVGYATAFVSQYDGAGRRDAIGMCVWHALYLCALAGAVVALVGVAGSEIFLWAGHDTRLAGEETVYFRLLTGGSMLALAAVALSCFWTGRGKIWTVLAVNTVGLATALVLNRLLIHGAGSSIPALGITGAGLATLASDGLRVAILLRLFLRPRNRERYNTLPPTRYDHGVARRLLWFGFGNGIHLMFSVGIMSLFQMFAGRHAITPEETELVAASGIAFSMNSLACIPILGLGTAVSVLVARGIGSGNSDYVRNVVRNGRLLTIMYAVAVCGVFALFPSTITALFGRSGIPAEGAVNRTAAFLILAAVFFGSDAMGILYGGALRGAGDTGFTAKIKFMAAVFVFVPPCLAATHMRTGLATIWHCAILCAGCTAVAYYIRFRNEGWINSTLIGAEKTVKKEE